jgi:hypothetical protein
VDADDGAVDQMHGLRRMLRQSFENAQPHAALRPAIKAILAGRIKTIPLGQIAQRRAGARNVEDAVQHAAIILPRHPARFVGQQRRGDRPFLVTQVKSNRKVLLREP